VRTAIPAVAAVLGVLAPALAAGDEPAWNELSVGLDANAGVHDLPRRVGGKEEPGWIGTSNVVASIGLQPKAMARGQVGIGFRGGVWVRTADFETKYSSSVVRPHVGLVLWARLIDTPNHRIQLAVNPGYYYGVDANEPESKSREFHEFANYAAVSYTFRPWALTVDAHNWYVNGLSVKLAGVPGQEDGVIYGGTLLWKPLAKSGIPVVQSLEPYVRYRAWGWTVGPSAAALDRKWWNEVTFGFRFGYDFSVFE